ncbi:hypothetical protein S40288_10106 [Stachybotrys chartarum IBT 40288]|nr:hypothetical protein S40288_10106 [Stachybotrys chartarum IBT 40288]
MGQVASRLRIDRSREGFNTAVVGTGDPPAPTPLRREATQDEIDTLPHVADRVPFAAWAVVVAGAAERATYFGIISPWRELGELPFFPPPFPGASRRLTFPIDIENHIQNPRGDGALPGILGLGQSTAVNISNAFIMFSCLTPTLFALVADLWLGRFKTLMLGFRLTNVASLSAIPITILEFRFDFWPAYLLGTSTLCLSIILFVLWAGKLVKIVPHGSILPQAARALVLAAKNGFRLERAKPTYQKTHYQRLVPWSDQLIDELSRGLIVCRIILTRPRPSFSLLVFYLCITQLYNNLISQAGQTDLGGVPNDMIQAFASVAVIVFAPLIQAMYSFLGRHGINFPPVARMTVGFFISSAAMAYAAGFQHLIYSTGPCFDKPLACDASQGGSLPNGVNVWIQLPVYVLLAIGEILSLMTAFEYVYNKAPKDMKTVVQALAQLTAALASALGMAISPVARDPNMVVFYASLAGAMTLTAVLVWWRFAKYDRIDTQLNQLADPEGATSAVPGSSPFSSDPSDTEKSNPARPSVGASGDGK